MTGVDRTFQNMQRNADGRWRRASRLSMAAFLTFGIICVLWMLPWLPTGLDPGEYSPELTFTTFLLAGCAATGILAFALRDLAARDQARVAALGAFYDEATGMNNRFYLLDRLVVRSEKARRSDAGFSLMILKSRITDTRTGSPVYLPGSALHDAGQAINKLVGRGDIVATLGSTEFAIVADRFPPKRRADLPSRLRDALARGLPASLAKHADINVAIGLANYPVDETQPEALIATARANAQDDEDRSPAV